jgi:aryl-alcohol dehydrogenase-like predicted oxidoreductase
MKTLPLGNNGPHVSEMCLGAMKFGTQNTKAESFALLDQYTSAGGSFIDTANIYAHWEGNGQGGDSEALLGQWMKERRNRDELFIATKVGFEYAEVKRGLKSSQIEEECHKSLRRLNLDTIDLYYAHVDDRQTPLEETLAAFDQLHRTGKVRYIGASNYRAWRLAQARLISENEEWIQFCCIQQRFTYLRPKRGASFDPQISANEDLLDYVSDQPVRLLGYSPLLSGAYTRNDRRLPDQYLGVDSQVRLAVLREVADETGATVNQVIFAWMLQSKPAIIPLIAASTPEQMTENLDALSVTLSEEQVKRLNDAGM